MKDREKNLLALFGLVLGTGLALSGCSVVGDSASGSSTPLHFEADFDAAGVFTDLFPSDLGAWTNVQCVQASGDSASAPAAAGDRFVASGGNAIYLDTVHAVSGSQALKFVAPPSGATISKAAIAKEGLDVRPGGTLTCQFRLYLATTGSAENVFLFDLESTELAGYPGRRLMIDSGGGLLLESKGGIGMYNAGRSFSQPAATKVRLPSEQWVTLKVVLHLARDGSGTSQVWQDGTLIIDAAGRNFPVEATITRYNWVEFGLTANSSALAQTVWIDDVDLSIR